MPIWWPTEEKSWDTAFMLTTKQAQPGSLTFEPNHYIPDHYWWRTPDPDNEMISFWVMADEAHITSIAVREAYRRQGLGELLVIPVIDLARELKARIVTLEVRASNTGAQNLYAKYGFTQVGVRRGYYIDDREDALVMSTQDITLATFQAHLEQLKQAYSRKWGIALNQIAR